MKWRDWLERWGMSSLSINAGILNAEWTPRDPDRSAAWELYVELLTRIATQDLPAEHGDEKTAFWLDNWMRYHEAHKLQEGLWNKWQGENLAKLEEYSKPR